MKSKGQVTVFIIIAIIIVAVVAGFLIFRNQIFPAQISTSASPVYTTFTSCLEDYTQSGIDILESQGGYIYLPDFEAGSNYMPFSSQLNFAGNAVPFWYYVSGNNIEKEQVPTKSQMQQQLATYIESKIRNCRYEDYIIQGFEINQGEPKATVTINKDNVNVDLDMDLTITKDEETSSANNHNLKVNSNLGGLYDTSRRFYDYEQQNLVLEKYGVDVLNLYAPVTGVEISCSPKIWDSNQIFSELQDGIESNTQALKIKNDQYTITNPENKYFIIDFTSADNIRFLNSKNWTYNLEVGSDSPILLANPVGNQPGLGILGFCYIPYHFVYNIKYPVLVQVSSNDEIFQFPLAVVIIGNNPRKPLDGSANLIETPQLCTYKNTPINVRTTDNSLNSIDADVLFECFATKCDIGRTTNGVLQGGFPQCANGYIIAKADGYKDAKYPISTINSGEASIVLEKLYNLNVELKLDGQIYSSDAIISFDSGDGIKTISYPLQKSIDLNEAQYEITVNIFRDSQLSLQATTMNQCVEVPRNGIFGAFGLTQEKCFDVTIPEQTVTSALAGGGKQNYYILESELANSRTIEINAQSLPAPSTLEQLQTNSILIDSKKLDINLK